MLDAKIKAAVDGWLNDPAIAEEDKSEIRRYLDEGNDQELADRFFKELEFGTGGMRGTIGQGINRMNVYTVGAAAQGLANYIAAQGDAAKKGGVVIAYDNRRMSVEFSLRAACVMAGNGIKAYLFESLRPTPELSYAVRKLGCTAGIVVTASHNPPEYNGFKAYWSDGVQVTPPHDENIIKEVRAVGGFGNVQVLDADEARSNGLLEYVGQEMDEAFLAEVQSTCLNPDVCRSRGKTMKIVFTGLHGTGNTLVPEALKRRGFQNVFVVPEQAEISGDFPTVKSPNPEEGAALDMAVALAMKEGADLVIGTDPDADRVGIAVRGDDGAFKLITGNQTAAMLTYYICEQMTRNNAFPDNAVLVTTIVSGDMMKDVARSYGAEVVETLTGFKWIGEKVCQYEAAGTPGKPSKTYIFGGEESYGYMPAIYTRDKDAVTSAAVIAEMAAVFAEEGKTLWQLLNELYKKFGFYYESTRSVALPGAEGAGKIQAMMDKLSQDPPTEFGGIKVDTMADINTGRITKVPGGKVVGQYELPPSNVILFTLADKTKVVARPSGTEPKIKFYALTSVQADDVEQARAAAADKVKRIFDDLTRDAG